MEPEGPFCQRPECKGCQEVAYQTRDGFLTGFSPRFREALLEVQVPYLKMTRKDAGELAYVPAKVFLPSRTELGKGPL